MNPTSTTIIKAFYLTLSTATLIAAAVQLLPPEGFPPTIELGPQTARAQSPMSSFGSTPAAVTSGVPSPQGYPPSPYVAQPAVFTSASAPAIAPPTPSPVEYSPVPDFVAAPSVASPQVVPQNAAYSPTVPSMQEVAEPPLQEFEGTKIVARVGGEVILAGDVISSVNVFLARNGVDPNDPEVKEQKEEYIKMRLQQLVETRIVVNEARRKIPAEGYKKAMEKFDEEFMKSIAPKMARERDLPDVAALEQQLKRDGTSLEREKRSFAEAVLSNSWMSQNIKVNPDVPHMELLQYYQAHAADYEITPQARWEQITMRFDSFPSKADAHAALCRAGNQLLEGRPFHEVARESSQGSTASQGGAQPWTKKGSLVSKPLDEALFALPLKQFSPIIEDAAGFHIVRVLERIEAGRVPFTEAQVEIRKKIQDQRTDLAKQEANEDMRRRTTVWTIYDKPQATASAPSMNR